MLEKMDKRGPFSVYPSPICPVCDSSGRSLHKNVVDTIFHTEGNWDVSKCIDNSCGTTWLNPQPNLNEISKFYTSYYTHQLKNEGLEKENHKGKLKETLKTIASKIFFWNSERYFTDMFYLKHRKAGFLLDIGCGSGELLALARSCGWQVCGCEFDDQAASIARKLNGVNVDTGDIRDICYAPETYDAVTMNNVIEHIDNGKSVIEEIYKILKLNGVLISVSPNPKSFLHNQYGQDWRGLEVPRHLCLYPPQALKKMAYRAGFRKVIAFSAKPVCRSLENSSKSIYSSRLNVSIEKDKNASIFTRLAVTLACHMGIDIGEYSVIIAYK